ncbi:MAG TPA: cytochrome c oxidase subunit II [Mucilaginibacter sp.]|jgi:cytochrome c oxidase subunit 2
MIDHFSVLLEINPGSVFDAASPQAEKIKGLMNGFIIAATSILSLVIFLTAWITIKYRARKNAGEPVQVSGNHKLELVMVGIPLALIVVFFFWSFDTMHAVLPDRGNQQPDIVVTGHQWFWEAAYPGKKLSVANEIHLPTGKKILMQLNSADVIHDWWVPSLGGKMDMIPGIDNYLWMTINKPGVYDGACSEFCGQEHAWMRIKVVAQSPADFSNWLNGQASDAAPVPGTLAKEGAALFLVATCSNCHSVRGTGAEGIQGPDLTHFASRQTMLAGMMANNHANVNNWLTDPQKIKPGAHMPRFIFSKDSILALTAYLEQLK